MPDGLMDAPPEQLGYAFAPNAVQIKPQILYGPLAAMYAVEFFLQENLI